MSHRKLSRGVSPPGFALAATILLTVSSAWSQSYRVLYNFADYDSVSSSGLTVDAGGNAYGTINDNYGGGPSRVYELSPTSGYHLLYQFTRKGKDGAQPQGNLAIDSTGNLYGTTIYGGANSNPPLCNGHTGCGVVYKLSLPSNGVGPWNQTVLYNFCSQLNCADGALPQAGVILDAAGNLYGTTEMGGEDGVGTVFELTPSQSGWTESVIHSFGLNDGAYPMGGLIFDAAGNLYSTTAGNGSGGTVFELSRSGDSWSVKVLYSFQEYTGSSDGCDPVAGVTFDTAGNIYGTTSGGGGPSNWPSCTGFGTVFELTPGSDGSWAETIIYAFAGGTDGYEPLAGLAIDSSGNLYGTTKYGGSNNQEACGLGTCGTVFRLKPSSDGQWTEDVFHFASGGLEGYWPTTPVTLDASGNVYGTTTKGGAQTDGVVFRITP